MNKIILHLLATKCTDSSLFALYFIYRAVINIPGDVYDAVRTSPYAILTKVFGIVEKEGWDIARSSWLLSHGILKTSERQKSLFGLVDQQQI
ncbi:unnamed protein product [Adineta steineri]|uniref:Uncharacterized protein n=1 Tax=Adineta steineri TaxID=433720 RepID=A0A819HY42_9BILA|nr:unnamed protein product [Adineta steineri]CAF3907588.1 unnamed protein product [Adineta steineri]